MHLSAYARALVTSVFFAATLPANAADVFIAGLQPEVRPAGAPAITAVMHDDAWFARALSGVEPPTPESLRWLADQGAWFTPFTGRGMTGPYDIRGWHAAGANPAE